MINIVKKTDCSGCSACANICPKSCIEMKPDDEGFLYPEVDTGKCINCGLCDKICPIKTPEKVRPENASVDAFCLRARNTDVVKDSTSGGFFTPLCEYVLNRNGAVFGAAYTESKNIEHILVSAENKKDMELLRGSKYVQSNPGDSFAKVKKLLKDGVLVVFSGTPCQVEGLLSFLNGPKENLITVDLICHGTPSPMLWEKYINYQEQKYKSEVVKVSFRKKTYGYHSGTMELVFKNGRVYHGSARVDYMLKSFFKEISSRPSCYDCHFKTDCHKSDFTIFDCWNASSLVPGLKDDDLGYTNVFVNTEKGRKLLNELSDYYEYYPVDLEKAIELDGSMVRNSAVMHKERKNYYKDLKDTPLPEHIKKFIPVTKKDYIIENAKAVIYKLGLLNFIKKIKK